MIFLIYKAESIHNVIVYESISDLTSRVEWQDIFMNGIHLKKRNRIRI